MLILGRRPGDSIVIEGGITIVVLACDRGGVRLGIQAPSHVSILRGEIVAQVADENRRATAGAEAHRAWVAALGGARPAPGAPDTPGDVTPPPVPPGRAAGS
jgi:carbon storage regulator